MTRPDSAPSVAPAARWRAWLKPLAGVVAVAAAWTCVVGDDKRKARRAIIRHLLRTLAPDEIAAEVEAPSPKRLFTFDPAALEDGRLAR